MILKKLTLRRSERFLILLLILAITPYLILSLFSHPWTDDYCYSYMSRDIGFFKFQAQWYNQWTGRYFLTALLSLNPLVFGSLAGYKLIPIMLILLLFAALYAVVNEFTSSSLSHREKLLLVLSLLLVYFDRMPDVRPGLYWMAGTITSQLGNILLLFALAALLRLRRTAVVGEKLLFTAISSFLIIAAVGTNEIALVLLLLALLFFLVAGLRERGSIAPSFLFIFSVAAIAAYISITAPGNNLRMSSFHESRHLGQSVYTSFVAALNAFIVWLGSPPLVMLTFLAVMMSRRLHEGRRVFPIAYLLLSPPLLGSLMAIAFFPAYWSMGMPPPGRLMNVIYLLFLMGWLCIVSVATGCLSSILPAKAVGQSLKFIAPPLLLYLIIFFAMTPSNTVMVTQDLINGTAWRYDQELRQRYRQIRNDASLHAEVDLLVNQPRSLFFSDIGYASNNWVNECYARYFGKKSITLKVPHLKVHRKSTEK